MLGRKGVKHARDMQRDARAHQHIADTGKHGAVDRRQMGDLHFFEEVDADWIVMALFGQKDLNEV